MIYEILPAGRENALTGRTLADMFKCDIRIITAQIEKERRDGHPICATKQGYFLPANNGELQAYCDRLKGRAVELFKTRQALIRVLRQRREALNNG